MSKITRGAKARSSATAQVIALPVPTDDYIETRTGIPLVDADPRVVARRLRSFSWRRRCLFFNNIATDSFKFVVFCTEHVEGGEHQGEKYFAWFILKCLERIGGTLDALGVDRPNCDAAAVLFTLSLNPAHRRAARAFWLERDDFAEAFYAAARPRTTLIMLFNGMNLTWPGATLLHGLGVPDDPGVTMRMPETSYEAWCQQAGAA